MHTQGLVDPYNRSHLVGKGSGCCMHTQGQVKYKIHNKRRFLRIQRDIVKAKASSSSFLKTILLTFIEQISFGTSQVDNFRATIPIFFLLCTLLTVVGIRYSNSTTYHAATLKWSVVAFVANPDKRTRTHVWVTDHTLAITFLTESSNGNPGLLPAHNKIRMMLGHIFSCLLDDLPVDSTKTIGFREM